MKNDFWLILLKDFFHQPSVTNISTQICLYFLSNARKYVIISFRIRILSYPNNFSTQFMQPNGKPTAFETGMSSYEYSLTFIKIIEHIYFHITKLSKERFLCSTFHSVLYYHARYPLVSKSPYVDKRAFDHLLPNIQEVYAQKPLCHHHLVDSQKLRVHIQNSQH